MNCTIDLGLRDEDLSQDTIQKLLEDLQHEFLLFIQEWSQEHSYRPGWVRLRGYTITNLLEGCPSSYAIADSCARLVWTRLNHFVDISFEVNSPSPALASYSTVYTPNDYKRMMRTAA